MPDNTRRRALTSAPRVLSCRCLTVVAPRPSCAWDAGVGSKTRHSIGRPAGSSGNSPHKNREETMKRALSLVVAVAALSTAVLAPAEQAPAQQPATQQPLKIGLILPYTGQFTD